ncbi:hypothetical protein [Amycolatopsis thermoflava]|uniref:hypothetical protein n=1 Tax=Amycolatopsis thermoflava TaxID=84480 RepID=UPI0012F77475|nr:hypothetical protein [Amycolatopsis thermoflava]
MLIDDEIRHLEGKLREGEQPGPGGLEEVTAVGSGDARAVLSRARDVLKVVLEVIRTDRVVELEEWRELLPNWFVEKCANERTLEEEQQWLVWWRGLPREQQARAVNEREWTLADWLEWFEPAERQWFWWDATLTSEDEVSIHVEVEGAPAPLGALEWLLRCSGAKVIRR